MIGKVLAGHFKITQALSSGGFGQTFLAEDTHIPGNPVCVVKQLKPLNTSPQALSLAQRLFEQEARVITQLGKECNQIPSLQAYFTEEDEFYLVQEYVEGHTLDAEMLPGTQWTEAKVLELLQDVLPILKFIHSKGVIHRDIKPANLIRRQRDGKLVLIDFGAIKAVQEQVSAELDPTVATGTRIGTHGYAPTEQVRGKPRSNSDLYALGIVGIQALTGRSPSQLDEDSQTGEIVWQHLTPASSGLKAMLSQMTRYHFKDRYQSAEEALQAVQQLSQPAATVAATIASVDDFKLQPDPSPQYAQPRLTVVNPPAPPSPIEPFVSPEQSGEHFANLKFSNRIPVWEFCFLCFISYGVYLIPWSHKQWKLFKGLYGLRINAWLRAIFILFFIHSFSKKIATLAERTEYSKRISPLQITILYWLILLVSGSTSSVEGIIEVLISVCGMAAEVLLFLKMVNAMNHYYQTVEPDLPLRQSFTGQEIVWILVGLIIWAFMIYSWLSPS